MGFFDALWGWADSSPKNWSGPPLFVDEEPSCFVVRDHSGQKLARVDFEDDIARRLDAKLLTKTEARRIADNIANLPGLVTKAAGPKTVKSSWW